MKTLKLIINKVIKTVHKIDDSLLVIGEKIL